MEGIRKGDRGRLKDLSEVFNRVWVDCAWGRELGFFLELGPRSTFQNLVFDNKFLTIFGMPSIPYLVQFTIIFRAPAVHNAMQTHFFVDSGLWELLIGNVWDGQKLTDISSR